MKKCFRCGKEKSLSSFHKCKRNADGRNAVCSICRNTENRERRGSNKNNPVKEKVIRVDFRSGILSKKDYCRTLEILTQMGYDITKNIHEQFCEKFSLPKKETPPTNKLKWGFQDCINNEQ